MLRNAITVTRLLLNLVVIPRSRISRQLYGVVKMLALMPFASARVFKTAVLEPTSPILATGTVGFCLLRGLPIFTDTYKTLRKRDTNAKRLLPISQSTKKFKQQEIPKKAVR